MAQRKEQIVVAATELVRRQGFGATSIAQISSASGATVGSIYHFFPGGKDEIGRVVVETTARVYRELFEVVLSEAPDVATAVADFFAGAAAVLEESEFLDPCPVGGIAREVANTNEGLRMATAAAFDLWIDTLASRLLDAGVPVDDARDLAQAVIATLEGSFVLGRALRSSQVLTNSGRRLAGEISARCGGAAHAEAPAMRRA